MDFFGHGRGRCRGSQEQALSNPIRVGILELFTKDEARHLTATALATDLAAQDRCLADVSVSQVGYHLARLRDAELIPAGKAKGH